ncbi:hypothetical protein KAU86_00430 [bacterium]|nr:hypothetical protein [bacterium]MCK4436395.1 hypothetical protein [bacterium]
MEDNQKIVIGDKIITRKELFEEKEKFRKVRAAMPFEEKIKVLIELQKIAYQWGKRKDVIIWMS